MLSVRIASRRSSGKSSAGQRNAVPALLTRTSTRPSSRDDRACRRLDRLAIGDVAVDRQSPRRPARAIVATVAAAPSSSMSTTTTRAPACASPLAMRGPDPAAAARDTGDATVEAEEPVDEPGRDLEDVLGRVRRRCSRHAHALSSVGFVTSLSPASCSAAFDAGDDVVDLGQHLALEHGSERHRRVLRRDAHRRRVERGPTPHRRRGRRPRSRSLRPARPRSRRRAGRVFRDRPDDRVEVERLQRPEVDHLDLDPVLARAAARLQRELHRRPRTRPPSRPCPRASRRRRRSAPCSRSSGTGPRRP